MHYHALYWNLPLDIKPLDLVHAFRDNWHQGFVYLSPTFNDNSVSYILKYIFKSAPKFVLSSRKNGGIGSPLLPQLREFYKTRPLTTPFQYIDRYSGQIKDFRLCKYFLNKLAPSEVGQIPYKWRKSVDRLSYLYQQVRQLRPTLIKSLEHVRTYLLSNQYLSYVDTAVIPFLRKSVRSIRLCGLNYVNSILDQSIDEINNLYAYVSTILPVVSPALVAKRDEYLTNLPPIGDLQLKSRSIGTKFQHLIDKSLL